MIALKFHRLYPNSIMNKRRVLVTGLVAFLGGALLCSILLNLTQISPYFTVSGEPLLRFSSYEELVNFINTSSQYPYYLTEGERMNVLGADAESATSTPEYSTTNIQVEGVDEADIVKTDGTYLYVISNQTAFIIKAYPPEEQQILSRIKLNTTLHGIFINGDKLVVFGSTSYKASVTNEVVRPYYWPYLLPRTFINVYNISNRESPVLTRNVTLDGSYFGSRMIGDHAYTVINEPAALSAGEVKLPTLYYPSNKVQKVNAIDICYSNITDYYYTFTTIIAINIQNDAEKPTHETLLLGATCGLYVSLDNIYVTFPKQRDTTTKVEKTLIYRIHIEAGNIESQANGAVPGKVLNQFSMDEYDGYFRIATTSGSFWGGESSRNNVYVLNMSLTVVGNLENLAPGERIYSARFMGDRCYLVTFKQIDPFFTIDLSNPAEPEVLGYLKIPGFSSYLHPYDEDHIIGIGKQDSNVKMSLFNVTDVTAPNETAKFVVQGYWSDSAVLLDHKAFLFDKSKQLLALPLSISFVETKDSFYHRVYWQGVYVFNASLERGFVLKGNITHQESSASYVEYGFQVQRILYIDNVLYTISDRKIKMNSLETLDEIGEIELS